MTHEKDFRRCNLPQKSVSGLSILMDNKWATNMTIHEQICTPDYEILTVSFQPFYFPQEFGQITIILIYVPGPKHQDAASRIAESYNTALLRAPDQSVFVIGDFNNCDLASLLPTLHQYIDCPTRHSRTLDRCFGNLPDAYEALCRAPLGESDHNIIHLLLTYRAKIKQEKLTVKDIQVWDARSEEMLQDCFDDTDWQKFFDCCSDTDELTETITEYIKFCETNFTFKKTI